MILLPLIFSATPISACGEISAPGEYYLTGDISGGTPCIRITANGVTLDGGGYTITASDNITQLVSLEANDTTILDLKTNYGKFGIKGEGIHNISLERVYIYTTESVGIYLRDVRDLQMLRVEVTDAGVSTGNSGVYLQQINNGTINDVTIDHSGKHGFHLMSCSNMSVIGLTSFNNTKNGVYVYHGSNLTFKKIKAYLNNNAGVYIASCSNAHILFNSSRVYNNTHDGFYIFSSSNISINGLNSTFNGGSGVASTSSSDVDISNVEITHMGGHAVYITNGERFIIRNMTVFNTSAEGIYVLGGSYLNISQYNAAHAGGVCLSLINSNHIWVSNVDMDSCLSGIEASNINHVHLSHVLTNNASTSLSITDFNDTSLTHLYGESKVALENGQILNVSNITVANYVSSYGMIFDNITYMNAKDLRAFNDYQGIYLNVSHASIYNVSVNNTNTTGIYIENSTYVDGANISSNHSQTGMYIINSTHLSIDELNLNQNQLGVYLGNADMCAISHINGYNNTNEHIQLSNVNNTNISMVDLSEGNIGVLMDRCHHNTLSHMRTFHPHHGVVIQQSTNINVSNFTSINAEGMGAYLFYTNSSVIHNITVSSSNSYGLCLDHSFNNSVEEGVSVNNAIGLLIYGSRNNISRFNITHSTAYGLYLYSNGTNSTHNRIDRLEVSYNPIGIYISNHSDHNRMTQLYVHNNTQGIILNGDYNNISDSYIFHQNATALIVQGHFNTIYNNWFNNTENLDTNTSQYWNTSRRYGYSIIGQYLHKPTFMGGNYWGNPLGTGFSDVCPDTDEDGICDNPYNLSDGGVDYLPLSYPRAYVILSCFNISVPGRYRLKADIWDTNETVCININTSNVSLLGENHSIIAHDVSSNKALYIHDVHNISVDGFRLENWDKAVEVAHATRLSIQNIQGDRQDYGVYMNDVENARIMHTNWANTGDASSGWVSVVADSRNVSIVDMEGHNQTNGLSFSSTDNSSVSHTQFMNTTHRAFNLYYSDNNNISHIKVADASMGIYVFHASNTHFYNASLTREGTAIYLDTHYTFFSHINIQDSWVGIEQAYGYYNGFDHVNMTNISDKAVFFSSPPPASSINFSSIFIEGAQYGIYSPGSHCRLWNITIINVTTGIYTTTLVDDISMENMTIINGNTAVDIRNAHHNHFRNITLRNNLWGIKIANSHDNEMDLVKVEDVDNAVYLDNSKFNTMTSMKIAQGENAITILDGYNNTVHGAVIEDTNKGIELLNTENATISSIQIDRSRYGILLNRSSYIYLSSSNMSNGTYGVYISNSSNTTLNHIKAVEGSYGVYMDGDSHSNELYHNYLCSNSKYDIYDADSNHGDNNTFTRSYNWVDDGQPSSHPMTYECPGYSLSSSGTKKNNEKMYLSYNFTCPDILHVWLKNKEREPISGVAVTLYYGINPHETKTTNSEGYVMFNIERNGTYSIVAVKSSYETAESGKFYLSVCASSPNNGTEEHYGNGTNEDHPSGSHSSTNIQGSLNDVNEGENETTTSNGTISDESYAGGQIPSNGQTMGGGSQSGTSDNSQHGPSNGSGSNPVSTSLCWLGGPKIVGICWHVWAGVAATGLLGWFVGKRIKII